MHKNTFDVFCTAAIIKFSFSVDILSTFCCNTRFSSRARITYEGGKIRGPTRLILTFISVIFCPSRRSDSLAFAAWCKNKRATGARSEGDEMKPHCGPLGNDSLQPADRFIIPKTTERRTYDRFIRIQSESPRSYGYLSSRRPAESPGGVRPPTKEKKKRCVCVARVAAISDWIQAWSLYFVIHWRRRRRECS